MNTKAIILTALLFYSAISFSNEKVEHNTESEILSFLNRFFISAREYSIKDLSNLLSRKQLEENIRSITIPGPEEIVLRAVRQIFSLEFSFGADCRIYVDSIKKKNQWTMITLLTEQEDYANVYQFFLTEEVDNLRLNHTVYVRKSDLPDSSPEIDVCDVPINWNNPSLLKPEETIQEQRERLGIP